MGVVEFELQRTIKAPIADVFARLADVEGHNEWMPKKGSIHRNSTLTSPGPAALGTTYVDSTTFGKTPGEIVEFDPPRRLAAPLVGQHLVGPDQDGGVARLQPRGRG